MKVPVYPLQAELLRQLRPFVVSSSITSAGSRVVGSYKVPQRDSCIS